MKQSKKLILQFGSNYLHVTGDIIKYILKAKIVTVIYFLFIISLNETKALNN